MKLSVFTTVTDPDARGDDVDDALECYDQLADEVVVVDGTAYGSLWDKGKLKCISYKWPKEFSWRFIGEQFTRGYEACTGDWVIRADIDMVWHERDFDTIRRACENNPDVPALSFYKWQFVLPDRYNLKSRLVLVANRKKFGSRIRFDSGGDVAQMSLDGKYITPDDVPQVGVPLYNYEKLLKTEAQIKDDVGRMARAWHAYHGEYRLGGPENESAYAEWLKMAVGRFNKPQQQIPLSDHPKYVQETIANLRPYQWGYNGFGCLGVKHSNYVG